MTTVFFDIDTQIDFLFPAGALYVPGAENAIDRIAALNRYAAKQNIPLISTTDAHLEDDPEFRSWPPHCVAGCLGQQKPAATLLERRVAIPSALTKTNVAGAQQILIEKQTFNCFTNANLKPLLDQLGAERYIVYGVVTEICVKMALEGLVDYCKGTGRRIELVTDAVRSLNEPAARAMIASFTASGGALTTAAEVLA